MHAITLLLYCFAISFRSAIPPAYPQVFYADSLKFFLSLYGHKLPVVCMDISADGTILATGSADKNIKLWGMDFGDCHRSIFAHSDTITCLNFISNTHYLFSTSKV
jgi:U3 small nucleolar RNA-associated protein 12